MILKLALRNILGNGWRSLINIFIMAFILIGLIWMEAMWISWMQLAKTQQKEWEYGSLLFRVKAYDPFDAFSWEKSFAPIPRQASRHVNAGELVPILFSPSVIYPHGRMMNAMVKGIPSDQSVLKIPSTHLRQNDSGFIPVVIGESMSRTTKLQEGDIFTIRVKDSYDAFNTLDLQVAKVMNCPVPSLDMGTVWVDLSQLQEVKQLGGMATVLVSSDPDLTLQAESEFQAIPEKEFFADIDEMVKTKAGGQSLLFIMMIFLAMLAIFDTQTLAIFKRRKEIGMLAAMGMTKGRIVKLFTLEGTLYMLCGSVMALVLGFPIFWYFGTRGLQLPGGTEGFGIQGFSEPLKLIYPPAAIGSTLLLIFLLTALISWLPARKIAKMNPTDAIRGADHA